VKEKTPDGFGIPIAPSKVSLGEKDYLEWQIGYDIANTNSTTVVPQIKFIRNGETKYGHELSKLFLKPFASKFFRPTILFVKLKR